MTRTRTSRALVLTLLGLAGLTPPALARQQPTTAQRVSSDAPKLLDDSITAEEGDAPARRLVSFNEFEGPLGSMRVGFGLLFDYAAFSQDEVSKEQVEVDDQWKYRDGRILFSGRLNFKRATTWSAGVMYDAANDKWVMRQTGVMVAVPEIWGHIFVGRSKEGFSLNKVMVGYGGWTSERGQMSDATLPILADGIKWLGYVPRLNLLWNLGFYGDALSDGQSFSSYENQLSGRLAWAKLLTPEGRNLLHLGVSARLGNVNNGKLRLRARPGAWAAPYFVDTEEFAADSTRMTGIEVYARPGRFTFGSEYFFQTVDAPDSGNPMFHGGEVFGSWLITGEVRTYNTRGGYFNQISPKRPVFNGGPGAWEIVTQFSTIDLDSGALTGGKYWRFTPMVNWYLSDHLRLHLVYGYGSLNRFGSVGKTHFFQTRIQMQL